MIFPRLKDKKQLGDIDPDYINMVVDVKISKGISSTATITTSMKFNNTCKHKAIFLG